MKLQTLYTCLILIFICPFLNLYCEYSYLGSIHASEKVILNTKISPPYQIIKNGSITGSSVKTLKCIFNNMGISYEIRIVPWKRAKANIRSGSAHGYFSATGYDKLFPYAVLSGPIALEKWYLYYRDKDLLKGKNYKKRLKVGVIAGSNHSTWLKEKGYSVHVEVETYAQLFKLLKSGRINVFLADKKTADEEIVYLNLSSYKFYSKFYKYTPLGVYFTKGYLKKRKGFLDEFNRKANQCVSDNFILTNNEKTKIKEITLKKFSSILKNLLLLAYIKDQNRKYYQFKLSEIKKLASKWKKQDALLSNTLSKSLILSKRKSEGLITEIIVFDRNGLNVGQSDKTTDYYQGDELKYKKTFLVGNGAMFIDNILYDESSKKFQTQISFTVSDKKTMKPVGGITIGIDIENALAFE